MIVGKGLIASAFTRAGFDSSHHIIFAAGVSNSSENHPDPYEREFSMIRSILDENTTFVYFSTTSIFDPTKTNTAYIHHKLKVEQYLVDHADSYLIVRLPIMIGPSPNPNTLVNFLLNALQKGIPVTLHQNACRYLLAIDDLFPLLSPYLETLGGKQIINIPGSPKTSLIELVQLMEDVLQTKGLYTWIDEGACYEIPPEAGPTVFVQRPNYVREALEHYYRHHGIINV